METKKKPSSTKSKPEPKPITLGKPTDAIAYIPTSIAELDYVLNGGLVLGNTVLLGGARGAGCSALLLQIAAAFARGGRKAVYATGEMTAEEIRAYGKRLGLDNDGVIIHANPQGTDVEELTDFCAEHKAQLLVADSVQTATVSDVKSDVGTTRMINAVVNMLTSFGKLKRVVVLAKTHFDKNGEFAVSGLVLHLVDVLLRLDVQYALDPYGQYVTDALGYAMDSMIRRLSVDGKSRQGPANRHALVELTDGGFRTPSVAALKKIRGAKATPLT